MRPRRKKSVKPNRKPVLPKWDGESHSLFWLGRAVHHFSHEAPDQEEILETFQTAGWPLCLDKSRLRGKAIQTKKQLHDTIKNLNRTLKGAIHFHVEGNGRRIGWEQV